MLNYTMGSPHITTDMKHKVKKIAFLHSCVHFQVSQTYLVKTPAARPREVSLALRNTSSSDSKDNKDMTGPKISSFTQVISSVQLPKWGKKKRQEFGNTGVTLRVTCWLKKSKIVSNTTKSKKKVIRLLNALCSWRNVCMSYPEHMESCSIHLWV